MGKSAPEPLLAIPGGSRGAAASSIDIFKSRAGSAWRPRGGLHEAHAFRKWWLLLARHCPVPLGQDVAAPALADRLQEIQDRGRVIVGVKEDYAPFGFRDAEGTLDGLRRRRGKRAFAEAIGVDARAGSGDQRQPPAEGGARARSTSSPPPWATTRRPPPAGHHDRAAILRRRRQRAAAGQRQDRHLGRPARPDRLRPAGLALEPARQATAFCSRSPRSTARAKLHRGSATNTASAGSTTRSSFSTRSRAASGMASASRCRPASCCPGPSPSPRRKAVARSIC